MVVTSIERLLRNSSDSCKEIRRLYGYEGNIVFTDRSFISLSSLPSL